MHRSIAIKNETNGNSTVLLDAGGPSPVFKPAKVASIAITRSTTIAMAGGLVSQGLKFLVILYVARRFSVSEFGLLSFAIAVNAYMFVISNFGLNVFGSRAVAQSGVVSRALLAEICCLEAMLAVLGLGLALSILRFVPGISRLEFLLVALFGLSNFIQAGLFDWVFQGLHRQEVSAALNILWQGTWLVLTVVGINLGMGILAVPAGLCASALLAGTVGYLWIGKTAPASPLAGRQVHLLHRSWRTLQSAAPLGWGTLLTTLIVWGDTVAVRLIRGQQAAGWYAAGNRAALAVAMLGTLYVQGAFPFLSQTSQENQLAFERCFARTYADLAMLFVPAALWAIYYAREIILLLFHRTDYLAATFVFRAFQVAMLFFVANTLLGTGVLVACGQDRTFRVVLAGTAGAFLLFCPLFTWRWGIEGAAAAVLGAQIASWLWLRYETGKLMSANSFSALRWPLATGILSIAACRGLHLSLGAGFAVLASAQLTQLSLRHRALQGERL
jgi:polysaccharide transporter, PST family